MKLSTPIRAEALASELSVINADYTRLYKVVRVACPDCGGEIDAPPCATCGSTGSIDSVVPRDIEDMPEDMLHMIQDFRATKYGMQPVMMSKEKSKERLYKMTGLDKPETRTPWNTDMTPEQQTERESAIRSAVATLDKENIIARYMAIASDPNASAAEQLSALDKIASLKGYKDQIGPEVSTPPTSDWRGMYANVTVEIGQLSGTQPEAVE